MVDALRRRRSDSSRFGLPLGEPGGPRQKYLFDNDASAPYQWAAGSSATAINVTANVGLTECGHTASCGRRKHDGNSSTVRSHLEVIQLDAAGNRCAVTQSSEQTDIIGKLNHHYNISYGLSVLVLPTCGGSRNFRVRVDMKWISGNSVKIDGWRPDPEVLTNAVAVNSFYAPTSATVPSVAGLGQAAAQNAITAARLNTGTVTTVVNTAAAGTVLTQNPPAGTSVLPNTSVDLTVSLGGAAIPNLTGLSQTAATAALKAAGLTLGFVSYAPGSPSGTILSQYPAPGTVTALGSAVNLTVATGGPQVPNVLGLSKAAAVSALNNVGLTASVTLVKDCSNPGKIVDQIPAGGSFTPPGSTVSLTLDSGTIKTCDL